MSEDKATKLDLAKLEGRLNTQEERMNTKHAEYRTDIAHLAEQMAHRDAESARRENRLLIALIAVVGIATAILGLMIQLT